MIKVIKRFGPYILAGLTFGVWLGACGSSAPSTTVDTPSPGISTQLEVQQVTSPYGTFTCIVNPHDYRVPPFCFRESK